MHERLVHCRSLVYAEWNQGTGNKCTNLDLSVTYKRVVRGVVHKVTVSVCNSPLCKIKTFQLSTKREL